MIGTVLILTIVLGLLVFVHELGHFVSAKLSGIKVEEFGFGFPPRIAGVKRGDTIYSVNWIPLGGFVRIKGESGGDEGDQDSFSSKGAGTRAVILAAGVVMNLVLAWFLLSVGYVVGLPQIIEDLPAQARVTDAKMQVVSVLKDSPAEGAGIEPGDTILSVDSQAVSGVDDFRDYTAAREGLAIKVVLEREGRSEEKDLTPIFMEEADRPVVGLALAQTGYVSYPVYLAPVHGLSTVVYFVRAILDAFRDLFSGLFTKGPVAVDISGPVGIAVITAEVTRLGFRHLLQFTSLLSINLAIINIFPFPALDGGRLMFLVIERFRGRAVNRRLEAMAHNIGFALLLLLVLVITYVDVIRFGDRIRSALGRFFGF